MKTYKLNRHYHENHMADAEVSLVVVDNLKEDMTPYEELGKEIRNYIDTHGVWHSRIVLEKRNNKWVDITEQIIAYGFVFDELARRNPCTMDDADHLIEVLMWEFEQDEIDHFSDSLYDKRDGTWLDATPKIIAFLMWVSQNISDVEDAYKGADEYWWDIGFKTIWNKFERSKFNVWRKDNRED